MAATECCSSSLFGFWTLCWCSTFTLFWLFSGLLWILVISCPDYSFLRYLEGYSCLNLAALIKDVGKEKRKKPLVYSTDLSEGHFLSHSHVRAHTCLICQLVIPGFLPCTLLYFPFFSFPPLSVFFSVAADWQIEAEVSPGPPSPAALCDPLFSACLCWYGRVTSGASCWKPYTMTQKWTLPVVQEETVKENTCDQTLTKKKIKLEAERGVVASRATEQAEMGMLLLIEYKLVFNKTHFTMFAVYWPTLKSTC